MTDKGFTTCLWFDDNGEEAANYYVSIFKDGKLGRIGRYTEAEAISFQVMCEDQDEVDYYWNKLSEGGQEVACGWLKDRYGVSWQVIPRVFIDMVSDADPEKARRATEAMLKMTKFDVAEIERAYAGG